MKNQFMQHVKTCYRQKLEEILAQEQVNFQAAKKDVIEAEGRMVTRYDSTKTEVAWLANSRLAEIKVLEKEISRVFVDGKINIGDEVVVRVLQPNGESVRQHYFIGAGGADSIIEVDEVKEVTSPEAKCLLGNMQEDVVEVEYANGSKSMQIIEVQKRERKRVVLLNTVVRVDDEEFGEEYYFITESRGGISLELEQGIEVMVVNVKTPLALALLGKKIGQQVKIDIGNNYKCQLRIEEIFF